MKRFWRILVLVLLASFPLCSPAMAQGQTIQEEILTYSINTFDGKTYNNTFCPENQDTMFFIAGHPVILLPVMTVGVFSEALDKYMVGLQKLSELVEGKIELMKGGKVIETLEERTYSMFYAAGYYEGHIQVLLDKEAEDKFVEYQEAVNEYYTKVQELMVEYREKMVKYSQEVMKAREEGEPPPEEPEIPEEPPRPEFYVMPPQQAFILDLDEGTYQIRLRANDGTIIEGSEKNIVVFSARRMGGIGLEVIPEERWTRRDTWSNPSDIMYVYVEGKPVLYFRPFQQNEYVDLYYAKLLDPQNPGSAERYRWVNIEQKGALTLQLLQGGKVVKTIHEMPYMVAQIPGAALGYNVVDYNPEDPNMMGRSPSLIAYKLALDMSGGGYTLRLVDPKTKEVLPGSERELRLVKIRESKSVYLLPSLIPLIAGLGVFIWRRTK